MILGIDPGLAGALVLIDDGELIRVLDMPVVKIKNRNRILPAALADMIQACQPLDLVVVEHVRSRPGEGVSSAFTFGFGLGIIHGVLAALDIPALHPTPDAWKRRMKLTGKGKDAARLLILERWPQHAKHFQRKKDVGRADAALLALYGEIY